MMPIHDSAPRRIRRGIFPRPGKFRGRRARLAALCLIATLAGCSGYAGGGGKFVSKRHGFEIRTPKEDPWRRTPDVADLLALNDPSTSVLYYDNPYSGGVISLQVLPRHYPERGKMEDELRYIYRRLLSTPYVNMRTVAKGRFIPFERALHFGRVQEVERAEFFLKGSMGRRPSIQARELARQTMERDQPFGGPRTSEEVKAERQFRSDLLNPKYSANYRGKVVVFLREGTLYEFYYIDHEEAYEKGLPVFEAFVKSIKFVSKGFF